jgi:hypothetical protein
MKVLKLLKPKNAKQIPNLLNWELFSDVGIKGVFRQERKIRNQVEKKFNYLFPIRGEGFYSRYDWKRLELALLFCNGKSLLDIGPYNGAFLEMCFKKGFNKIVGVDICRHRSLLLPPGASFDLCDVTQMKYQKESFDVVCAMEIIEHLPPKDVFSAIKNIRSVAKYRIIYSLPFKEPHPLYKETEPSGHKQSFNEKDIRTLFPQGYFIRVEAGLGVPWVVIIEDKKAPNKDNKNFHFLTAKQVLSQIEK